MFEALLFAGNLGLTSSQQSNLLRRFHNFYKHDFYSRIYIYYHKQLIWINLNTAVEMTGDYNKGNFLQLKNT